MLITKAKEEDISILCEMELAIFQSPWLEEDFVYELTQNPFSTIYLLKDKNEVIGYVGIWDLLDQIQITTVAIDEKYRNQGHASTLVHHCIQVALEKEYKMMSLEVRVSNKYAIRLYEKHQFEIKAIRKGYYQDNHEDAYLMVRETKEDEVCQSY